MTITFSYRREGEMDCRHTMLITVVAEHCR